MLVAHFLRVSSAARVIPSVSVDEIAFISELSLYHDIGKPLIPHAILDKPEKLTPQECYEMKCHTIRGCGLLKQIPELQKSPAYRILYDICRHHHERWDGTGYPDGLSGGQITPYVQVIGFADAYDALRTDRPYRRAFSHDAAMWMLFSGACGSFNPVLLNCLQQNMTPISGLYDEEQIKG